MLCWPAPQCVRLARFRGGSALRQTHESHVIMEEMSVLSPASFYPHNAPVTVARGAAVQLPG